MTHNPRLAQSHSRSKANSNPPTASSYLISQALSVSNSAQTSEDQLQQLEALNRSLTFHFSRMSQL